MSYDLSEPAALISTRMGLQFPQDRWPELTRGLERTATNLGFEDIHKLIVHLLSGSFGQREIQALAAHLTIGETHFFRTPETFAMLQSRLLPQLIAAHQNTTRTLRIWSAGCAAGQEPFSLAILISRLIPDIDSWDVTILGTDINPEAFAAASTAEYTQWSFRGTPSWVVNGYFTKTPEGRYRLSQSIKDMVTFRYLNLAEDAYPTPGAGVCDFDLILCRNVIMYFSRETAVRVADRLHKSLREGGYLLVTPSEASRDIQRGLSQFISDGEIVYQKTPALPPQPASAQPPATGARVVKRRRRSDWTIDPVPARTGRRKDDQRTAAAPQQRKAPAELPAAAKAERRTNGPDTREAARQAAAEARLLADKGELTQALAQCDAALEGDKLNPSVYYLKASILQELGRPDEAERALQSTLFLDGSFALARVMLGAIARGQSRSREAAIHFRAALSQLEQMPSDSVLPETDGLTAGEMAETVASLMESECVS